MSTTGKTKYFSKRLTCGKCVRACVRQNFLLADAPAEARPHAPRSPRCSFKNAHQKQPTPQKAACSGLPLHISFIPARDNPN